MGLPKLDIDPALRDALDRYILLSNKDEDNLRRGELVRPYLKSCGLRLQLAPGATIPWPDKCVIGDDVYIGLWTYIGGGDITLEDRVMIGPHCSLTAGDHRFNPEKDDYSAPHKRAPIVIGHGTWLAAGAVVTCGVRVGRANLVAAGAVVTKDTPDYAIMAGVPARPVGTVRA
jgi:acetyltransferase-like isoleucine patch superfamily enzyme